MTHPVVIDTGKRTDKTAAVPRLYDVYMARKNHNLKKADLVTVRGETGTFVIYGVDESLQTAELQLINRDLRLSSISWDALTLLDKKMPSNPAKRRRK